MTQEEQIDEALYSRQLYVLGVDAMKKMTKSSVLISGIGGLGLEIAKNVVLAGINKVVLHDSKEATILDLGSQFYLTEEDIGKNRAAASIAKVRELNHHCNVSCCEGPLTKEMMAEYNTVVITEPLPQTLLNEYSEFCHEKNICFIACETSGVFGFLFNDFGHKFVVTDPRGEQPSRFMIEYVTNSEHGVVTCAEGGFHNMTDGDMVRFEEIEGMTELNGKEFPVTVISASKFEIGDTSKFHPYEVKGSGGFGNQIIMPKTFDFATYKAALASPMIVEFDFCAFGRDRQVFLAFVTMHRLLESHKNVRDVPWEEVLKTANSVNAECSVADSVDEVVLKALVEQYGYVISPTASVLGGIIGQEVLKSVSGKFVPVQQFLCFHYMEAQPEKVEYTLKGDRYDPYRVVFGDAQQQVMENLRYFMIGAGAIGCEILKNWAMMGVATGPEGKAIVTDMDRIEKSNLSRQFLFRDSNIGQMKSESACAAVLHMNNKMHLEAQTNKLDETTRDIYNDKFYTSLSGVCNALDNIPARIFSDSMCVYYQKPLLESGTLGPKASYQVVVPTLTESYASSADPPEQNIPACTLHNFPSIIDHCCLWGRDIFSGIFEEAPALVNKFIDSPNFVEESKAQGASLLLQNLRSIYAQMTSDKPENFDDCVRWARMKFEELFNWKIRDLLHMFPLDHVTESGALFWSGSKRPPTPLEFDAANEYHAEFVVASALLHARIYGIEPLSREHILSVAASVPVKEWSPSTVEIDVGDEKKKPETPEADLSPEIAKVVESIKELKLTRLHPEVFEKDDDSNSHMDFIAAAANLRALNYKISTASKLEIKRIAGKIIPAISTTTAMVCGFVCLEMYKVHSIVAKKIGDYRSGFINLATVMFSLTEPCPCVVKKFANVGEEFSPLWDTVDIDGDMTVKEFIDFTKQKWNIRVMTLEAAKASGKMNIYAAYLNSRIKKERLPMKITDVAATILKAPLPDDTEFLRLSCICYNDQMEEVPVPDFRLFFRRPRVDA